MLSVPTFELGCAGRPAPLGVPLLILASGNLMLVGRDPRTIRETVDRCWTTRTRCNR
jgi:hypothetical protein